MISSSPKGILASEWKQRSVLPTPPSSPPPSSPQKVHAQKEQKERVSVTPAPAKPQPSSSKSQLKPSTPVPVPMDVDPTPVTQPSQLQLPKGAPKTTPKTPELPPSSDMDVDIGGTPEPEPMGRDAARDDEIVRQLERGLPRWEGFAEVGWAQDISSVSMRP